MKNTLYVVLLLAGVMFANPAMSQDEGHIYGKITLDDGKTYEGAIRWGKEEIYWNDIFNASKERNNFLKYLSSDEVEELRERLYRYDNDGWGSWDDRVFNWVSNRNDGNYYRYDKKEFVHQFACQFGDIKAIYPTGSRWVELELRDGTKVELDGEGYNDIGTKVQVADKELGEIDLYWNRIEKVEFMNTPSKLAVKFGEPLYGTVEAFGNKYTGYIQWDKDERVTTDKLDGDSEDGKMSIEFGKIKSIERRGSRSIVTLKSGREFTMTGSNDVSEGHRGIIVMNKDFVAVELPWDECYKVDFEEKPGAAVVTYNQFKPSKQLNAKVTTADGKTVSGRIVYDLDEEFDHELLQGKAGDIEFVTAFRDVKKITAQEHRATIELRNGKTIKLDEAQDVGERNHGLLVFSDANTASYVPWEDVREIEFL